MKFWRGIHERDAPRGKRTGALPSFKHTANSAPGPLPMNAVVELQGAAFLLERQTVGLTTACLAESLDLAALHGLERPVRDPAHLAEVVSSCRDALERVSRAVDAITRPVVRIPSEFLYHSWLSLFPAERMAIIGGRRMGQLTSFGPTFDVTSEGPETNHVHVRADRDRLRKALMGLERAGAHLAGWIHSHPGTGPQATVPSWIDRVQHDDWVRDYTRDLISLIVVADGVVRLWGTAIEDRTVRIEIVGRGVITINGEEYVFQLAR